MANQVRIGVGVKDDATKPITGIKNAFKTLQNEGKKGFAIGVGAAATAKAFSLVDSAISGVANTIVGTIDKAAAFERGMLNINSIAKVSADQLKAMGQTVLKMSGEFGQSADTMTAALYDINSSGFAGAKGLEVLRAAAKGATAGLATTAEAASGITAVLNSYGMQASESARVSDVMFKTVERGVVTFGELSAEIGKTAALASPLGVSLEEVGAALAVMTRHGLGAEDATTQLNAIMASMLKPAADASALAKELGLDWSSAGLKANGLTGSLNAMIEKTGGSQAKMAVLLGDVRAIRGAFALSADAGGELNDELKIMKDAAGATDAAFGIQSQGAAFKMAQATARLDAALISLGTNGLPLVASGADALSQVLNAFQGTANKTTLELVEMSEAGKGGQADLYKRAKDLGLTVAQLSANVREIARVEREATYTAVETMRGSKGAWVKAAVEIGEALPEALEVAKAKAIKVARKTPSEIADALRAGREEWQSALEQLKDDVDNSMSRAAEIAKLKGLLAGKWLANRLRSAKPEVRAAAAALEETATARLGVLTGTAAKVGDKAARQLANAIKRHRKGTAEAAQLHEIAVRNALGQLPSSAYGWGAALTRNYARGITSNIPLVKTAAQKAANAAARNLRLRSPAEEGPLSGVGPEGWGKKLASDFAKGMSGGKRGIGAAASGLAGAATFSGAGTGGGGMALAGAGSGGDHYHFHFHGLAVAPTQAQAKQLADTLGPAIAGHLRDRGLIAQR